ncbi:hypothetical protein BDR22DRAFT_849609 [Usnea florida]
MLLSFYAFFWSHQGLQQFFFPSLRLLLYVLLFSISAPKAHCYHFLLLNTLDILEFYLSDSSLTTLRSLGDGEHVWDHGI